jgi:hypothetical protein
MYYTYVCVSMSRREKVDLACVYMRVCVCVCPVLFNLFLCVNVSMSRSENVLFNLCIDVCV